MLLRVCDSLMLIRAVETTRRGEALLKIVDGVRSAHELDGAVVLDINHGQMFTLNLVGSKILEMMERGWPESQIVLEISRVFLIRPDIVERDVREFLECLERNRLVEPHRESSHL
jgi:hypothetical protein